VTKTLSPHTAGVELPRSGNDTRQRTFSFVLQRSGRFFSAATPLPSGPRHAGQFAADTETASAHQSQQIARYHRAGQVLAARCGDGLSIDNGTE
jgi:hypothetical protein